MSQVIDQVWREVVGCSNWPVMWVPQFIALRRNDTATNITHLPDDNRCWAGVGVLEGLLLSLPDDHKCVATGDP